MDIYNCYLELNIAVFSNSIARVPGKERFYLVLVDYIIAKNFYRYIDVNCKKSLVHSILDRFLRNI